MIKQHSDEEIQPSRKRRKSHHSQLHEEGESWAVSYSDLLMVLMSFFIIFYNTEESTGKGEVESLVKKLNLAGITLDKESFSKREIKAVNSESNLLPGFSKEKKKKTVKREVASIPELEGMTITKIKPLKEMKGGKWNEILKNSEDVKYKGGILIDLEDNIYANGKFELSKKTQKSLKVLFGLLSKHQSHLNMVFIGHTDSIPVKNKKSVVDSNLILSHMRAAKAVEFAIDEGFDPMWVSSQGLSEYTRNTRSLSIRIMER